MPDLLVHLLKLPPAEPLLSQLRDQGIIIRRAQPFEMTPVRQFVEAHFATSWADEITPCYSRQPVSLYIAMRDGRIIGFGAYEATRRTYFGPTGVAASERGLGIGKALLLVCLWGLHDMGYPYGIIGGAGPVEFYEKAVGATVIPDSVPGVYADMLRKES